MRHAIILLCLLLTPCALRAEPAPKTGTLIVTYNTGPKEERIDRVRFRLTDEKGRRTLYPKNGAVAADPAAHTRTVVVSSIESGDYEMEFLIPNNDGLFTGLEPVNVKILSGQTTTISHSIKPQYAAFTAYVQTKGHSYEDPKIFLFNDKGDQVATSTAGALSDSTLKPGQYTVKFQTPHGFTPPEPVKVQLLPNEKHPPLLLTLLPLEDFTSKQKKQAFGHLEIKTAAPEGEVILLELVPYSGGASTRATLIARNGKLDWKSKTLPTGNYTVRLGIPAHFEPIEPIDVTITKNQVTTISPQLQGARKITVRSNTTEALYTLKNLATEEQWHGGGKHYTFSKLVPGLYTITFSSNEPEHYLAPGTRTVNVLRHSGQDIALAADYEASGELVVRSNVASFEVQIDSEESNTHIKQLVDGQSQNFTLPIGKYTVTFLPLNQQGQAVEAPIPVEIDASATEEVFGEYQPVAKKLTTEAVSSELTVRTNISSGGFTIITTDQEEVPVIANYQGQATVIPLNVSRSYLITFIPVANYQTPSPVPLTMKPNEKREIVGEYIPIQELLTVPYGKTIIGDPINDDPENVTPAQVVNINEFQIGKYEVTNDQYAFWLNDAMMKNNLRYKNGLVTDTKGKVLCKTSQADPKSQINAIEQLGMTTQFASAEGKGQHPVIFVTWHGANAYATANGMRLPTEAEWETAAGMEITTPDQPMHKYRYGFSRDTIDRSWANYKSNDLPFNSDDVRTTPVGFYDGMHVLPPSKNDTKQWTTRLAQSPVGAFDMSGNVWEWANDWYSADYYKNMPADNPQGPPSGDTKVAKGGCYDSLSDGVRVAERMALPPEHCDAFTGFRIAANSSDD